jgi:hypothetical protein
MLKVAAPMASLISTSVLQGTTTGENEESIKQKRHAGAPKPSMPSGAAPGIC